MGVKKSVKRRKRRQANVAQKFGPSAKPRHRLRSGRTGGVHHKRMKALKHAVKMRAAEERASGEGGVMRCSGCHEQVKWWSWIKRDLILFFGQLACRAGTKGCDPRNGCYMIGPDDRRAQPPAPATDESKP